MSTTYQDLPMTTFPDSVQSFPLMSNILPEDAVAVKGFQEAMMAGNSELANQYFNQISNAANKFINAALINTLFQTCTAIQRLYKSDFADVVDSYQQSWESEVKKMRYMGAFDARVQYDTNNYVTYYNGVDTDVYIAIDDPPVGTYPSNTNYWRLLTIVGKTGAPGIGMSFAGEWTAAQTYTEQNIVVYKDGLWAALQASTNQFPVEGSEYWQLIYRNIPVVYPYGDTPPENPSVGDLWFEIEGGE